MEIIKTALRSLLSNRTRSLLTMLGIIIGVGAVITMVAIGRGASLQVESALAGFRACGGEVSNGFEYLSGPVPEHIVYRTRHRDYDSSFDPQTGKIEFFPKDGGAKW